MGGSDKPPGRSVALRYSHGMLAGHRRLCEAVWRVTAFVTASPIISAHREGVR